MASASRGTSHVTTKRHCKYTTLVDIHVRRKGQSELWANPYLHSLTLLLQVCPRECELRPLFSRQRCVEFWCNPVGDVQLWRVTVRGEERHWGNAGYLSVPTDVMPEICLCHWHNATILELCLCHWHNAAMLEICLCHWHNARALSVPTDIILDICLCHWHNARDLSVPLT